ncbi:MAG: hypothetical protein HY790_10065 [Deltaproteobacteria bacterium]|nr:hypothetical protein [Deltaproteobacteria bacterium]MBI4796159.1 hypothetical protein [Deltaproteobacteria bacterium]
MVADIKALAVQGVGVHIINLAAALVGDQLPLGQGLQVRHLLGGVGWTHLKARGREQLFRIRGLTLLDLLNHRASGQGENQNRNHRG